MTEAAEKIPAHAARIGIGKKFILSLQKIKSDLKKEMRLLFLLHKVFSGSYADNEIDIRKFASERNIMVQYVKREGNIVNFGNRKNKLRAKKQARTVLYYVHDNMFTRWIGWKPSFEHYRLLGIKNPLMKALEADAVQEFIKRNS